MAEDAANDLGGDEAEGGDHGPAEHRRPQCGVGVPVVMAVSMVTEIGAVAAMLVVMARFRAVIATLVLWAVFVRVYVHCRHYSTRSWPMCAAFWRVCGDAKSTAFGTSSE